MIFRIFKGHITWSYGLFFFPKELTFKEIKSSLGTKYLEKKDFVGEFEFDPEFLSIFQSDQINNKTYYFDMVYEHDDYYKNEWNKLNEKQKPDFKKDLVSDIPDSLF